MQHSNSLISIFINIKTNIFGTIVLNEMIKFFRLETISRSFYDYDKKAI